MHGVGGPRAESVLECPEGATAFSAWRSEPTAASAVRHRSDRPRVGLYHWAPLTSGSRYFALWPLLLPFSLVNLAGWMQPDSRNHAWRGWITKTIVHLLAVSVTVATVVWVVWLGQVLGQPGGSFPGWWRLDGVNVLTFALSVVTLAVIPIVATHTSFGFDAYAPRWSGGGPTADDPTGAAGTFRDPDFFRKSWRDWVRRLHLLVGVAAVASVTAAMLAAVGRGGDLARYAAARHPLDQAIVGISITQWALLLFLLVAGWRSHKDSFRSAGAVAPAALGVALIGGLTATALLVVQPQRLPAGPVLMLVDVYGASVLAAGAVLAVVVVVTLTRAVPLEGTAAGKVLLRSLPARLRARVARLPHHVDLMLGGATLVLLVGSAWVAFDRHRRAWSWQPTLTFPVTVARWSFLALIGFMVLSLVKSRANPESLRRVGNVWDVVSFWPRSFHPFAVRSYAERAVPELQQLLLDHPLGCGAVVVAHSQGSVLVAAALAPYTTAAVERGIRVVTFGSPLRSLYSRAFPHFVPAAALTPGFEVSPLLGAIPWQNAFRYTDHVGRSLFTTDEPPPAGGPDHALADPRPGTSRVSGHNDYWTDDGVRDIVDPTRRRGS